jgi:hypothetical protein
VYGCIHYYLGAGQGWLIKATLQPLSPRECTLAPTLPEAVSVSAPLRKVRLR